MTSFFVLAYAWTWLCWWLVAADIAGHVSLPVPRDVLATLGQFGPFVAALPEDEYRGVLIETLEDIEAELVGEEYWQEDDA